MAVRITVAGLSKPISHIPIRGYVIASIADFDLVIVSDDAQAEAKLAASIAGWVKASTDGGSSWPAVPDNVAAGVELGPLTAGVERAFKVRLEIPGGASVRHREVGLRIGLGVGA